MNTPVKWLEDVVSDDKAIYRPDRAASGIDTIVATVEIDGDGRRKLVIDRPNDAPVFLIERASKVLGCDV